MTEPATAIQGTWLAPQPIWMQWIELPNKSGGKPRKFPLYPGRNAAPRGKRRSMFNFPGDKAAQRAAYDAPENNIELDSVEDRGRLTTFANLELQHNARPGYALGPLPSGHILCGVDLDDCYTVDGALKTEMRGFYDAAVAAGALVERSINRTGLHVVWPAVPSQVPETRKDNVEVYSSGRYFAWGSEILHEGMGQSIDMTQVLALLPAPPQRERETVPEGELFNPKFRNNFLFDRMVMLHQTGLAGDALKDAVRAINDRMVSPLDDDELDDTVFKRIGKFKAPVHQPNESHFDVAPDLAKLQGRYIRLYDTPQVMQSLKGTRYVLDAFIEASALGMLWGPPGSFKSFIALDWSACIATGTPWFGLPVEQGPVIYIAGEGRRGIARRLHAWQQANSVSEVKNLYVSGGAVNARDSKFAEEIIEMSEQIGKPRLIVIDTLARNFGGGDENSAQDVGQLIDVVDRQLAQHLGATVLLVHHSGKDTAKGARGSSALKGAVDFEYEAQRKGDVLECTLLCHKMKDSEPQQPVALVMKKYGTFTAVQSEIDEMLS